MLFDRFLFAVESRDLSQADKSIIRVFFSRIVLLNDKIGHRGLKLDGAIGQGEICNSLKSENFSKSFLSHIEKNNFLAIMKH